MILRTGLSNLPVFMPEKDILFYHNRTGYFSSYRLLTPGLSFLLFLLFLSSEGITQETDNPISEEQAKKHIYFLASDSLKGRVNFSEEQLIAADYIDEEFKKYKLTPLFGDSFYIPFIVSTPLKPQGVLEQTLYNMAGVLPGKTLPDEVIIFSAHYDHVNKGIDGSTAGIFNGANDNASGVAAVLMLADYFSRKNDNQRTIMFCLFAGEELGLYGSTAFAKMTDTEKIKAVINIEMIGQHNRAGTNSFFIVGSKLSDMDQIFKKNLEGTGVKLTREGPDPTGLIYRSDHFPFIQAGIVAHTIMSSDDNEPCYHKACDNPDRIAYSNFTRLVNAIAKASETMISGIETPKWKTKQKK